MEQQNDNNSGTLSTRGDAAEHEENLGATTNLSLDQLKEENDKLDQIEAGQEATSAIDDLNEIRAGDDLGEPDPEADDLEPTTTSIGGTSDEDTDLDEPATPAALDDESAENPENDT